MAFHIAEKGLGGGGGGHHGGHHGGGHHRSYWGRGGWGGGYPWYYDSYPTVYAEPIYITQEIQPDCGPNPCLTNTTECQAKCKSAKPVAGLGGISEVLGSMRPWMLVLGAALVTFGAMRFFRG
jgi:hypothetical protein